MIKLIGSNKLRTAIFISGSGTNLKSLINFSFSKKSPIIITSIISNNIKAKGLRYAKEYKIKKKVYMFKKEDEKQILFYLKKDRINLICLAGFMKILSKNFIKKFNGKIINIHPSLLPKYKGLATHKRVIENNERYSGCTVHLVNSKLDSGKIILQKKVKIFKKDTPESLASKVLVQEHLLYPKALNKIIANL